MSHLAELGNSGGSGFYNDAAPTALGFDRGCLW